MDYNLEFSRLWSRVWARRFAIALLVGISTTVVGVIAFTMPPWFRAEASLLPASEEESGFSIASLLKGVAVPGIKIPTQVTPADVFIAVLQSRRINEEMVKRFDLKKRYKVKRTGDAIKELLGHSKFKMSEAGLISLSVEDTDPKIAADMANAYIELLDRYNREVRMSKGRRTRLFVETRLTDTRRDLAQAEQRLANYQATHKTVAVSPEISSSMETAAKLYAQRAALEVKLGVIRSYSRNRTDEEGQTVEELAQLDRQLSLLPATGLEIARLLREVKVQEQVFILLTAQYEEARIDEARDVVTVDPLDVASPPEHKAHPKRLLMMAAAFALSLAIGVAYALFQQEENSQPVIRAVASE